LQPETAQIRPPLADRGSKGKLAKGDAMTFSQISAIASLSLYSIAVAGCAVHPSASYTKITKDNATTPVTDSYYLQTSTIKISAPAKDATAPQVDSVPTEYTAFKVGITSESSWLGMVDTNVNIAKTDNTALVKSVGVQVNDNRVATIEAIGGVAASALPLLVEAVPPLTGADLPAQFRMDALLKDDGSQPIPLSPIPGRNVSLTIGPLPPDAVSIDRMPTGSTHQYFYAACREAVVDLFYAAKAGDRPTKSQVVVKIADPRYFQLVSFPVKGSINMHSQCGVSVSTDTSSGVSTNADLITAVGKAITGAISAAKPASGNSSGGATGGGKASGTAKGG
jgi:hypothetical protein